MMQVVMQDQGKVGEGPKGLAIVFWLFFESKIIFKKSTQKN